MTGFFEHYNEPSVSIKCGECFNCETPQRSCLSMWLIGTDEDREPKIRNVSDRVSPKEEILTLIVLMWRIG